MDATTPITTSSFVDLPKNHRVYTTTREVAIEMPLPAIGSSMSTFLPGPLGANIVLDAWETPSGNAKKKITVQHTATPSGTFTERESVAYQFPPIYPNATAFFPGGSYRRPRNVIGRITYEFSRDPVAAWGASPAIWNFVDPTTGPFEVESYLAKAAGEQFEDGDGAGGMVGDFLNANFVAYDTINPPFTIYAPGDLFYAVPASRPSITVYAGWVANKTEIIVSRTIDDWLGDFSMRRTVYVPAQ